MLSAVTVALPAIANDLTMNAIQISWVNQSLTLVVVILSLPLGRLADIKGRKTMYTIGSIIFTASTLLSALSTSSLMLIILRLIQGIGLAMIWSTATALLTSVYTLAERGRIIGVNVAAVYIGISIGPTIGGVLTQNFGWRSIFLLVLILQLPALTLLFTKIKGEWAEAKGEKFDIVGSVLFAIMFFCVMYGFSILTQNIGIWVVALGIIVLIIFVKWELKEESPMFKIHLLTRNRLFAFSSLVQIMFYSSTYPVSFILSLYLQYIRGLSPQDAGFVLLAQPVIQAIFSPLAGRISDKVQPRLLVSAGLFIELLGIILLLRALNDTSLLFIIVSQVLLGIGIAFFTSPNTNAIMSSVDRKYYGVASAIQVTTRDIGISFGMGIMMLLFSLYMGTAQITPEFYPAFVESISTGFIVFAGICFCCIFVSTARGKVIWNPQD
jgi:EmrB/QacA subfamily drug resistance transporter